jgi:hypothetical protein
MVAPLFAARQNILAANVVVHPFISVVQLEGTISALSSLRASHELLDNEKNPEDQNKIRCGDANIHEYGNPLRGPMNKQNPQNMKNCDNCHSEPEPRLPPQFPFETNHYANHANSNHKGPHSL